MTNNTKPIMTAEEILGRLINYVYGNSRAEAFPKKQSLAELKRAVEEIIGIDIPGDHPGIHLEHKIQHLRLAQWLGETEEDGN